MDSGRRISALLGLSALLLFAQSASPSPHRAFNLGCEACHTTASWKDLRREIAFDHAQTGFPLTGQHSRPSCQACHRGANFGAVEGRCPACHKDIHRGEVGDACERCHDTNAWTPSQRLLRHQETRFPLLGAHALTDCATCHVHQQRGEYAGLPTDCVGCHRRDYQNARGPTHAALRAGTDCQMCHGVSSASWLASAFAHPAAFPLDGAHRTAACNACHPGGFSRAPTACDACHMDAYRKARNPNHAASGFPATCQECHTTNAWTPATFSHEKLFPIASGPHRRPCSECHTVPSDLKAFSCVDCHNHERTRMAQRHRNTRNYVYESRACFACHPTGREGGEREGD